MNTQRLQEFEVAFWREAERIGCAQEGSGFQSGDIAEILGKIAPSLVGEAAELPKPAANDVKP